MTHVNKTHDLGLFLIRLALGAVFVFHGAQKLFGLFDGGGLSATASTFEGLGIPLPDVSAVVAGCVELFGGLALVVGTGTRIAGLLLAFQMGVAVWTAHRHAFAAAKGGMEFPLTLMLCAAGLALAGSGAIALRPSSRG